MRAIVKAFLRAVKKGAFRTKKKVRLGKRLARLKTAGTSRSRTTRKRALRAMLTPAFKKGQRSQFKRKVAVMLAAPFAVGGGMMASRKKIAIPT